MKNCFDVTRIYSADFGRGLHLYHPREVSNVLQDIKNKNFNDVVKLVDDKQSSCFDKFILYIKDMKPNSLLLIEDPHMQPRIKDSKTPSKAQPWTEDQARKIIDTCAEHFITLRYVPGGQSPRNRATAGVPESDKCDQLDAMCIHYFYSVKNTHLIPKLKIPPNTAIENCFSPSKKREKSYEYKGETDAIMNNLRSTDYECLMVDWLSTHLETLHDCLTDEESRSIFELSNSDRKGAKKIDYYTYNHSHTSTKKLSPSAEMLLDYIKKNGRTDKKTAKDALSCSDSPFSTLEGYGILIKETVIEKGRLTGKLNALTGILATIMTDDGQLRIRDETQARPGWSYCKTFVLRMTPYHRRGGVARSNLYWHTLKNWIIKEGKEHNLDFSRKLEDGKNSFTIRRGHFSPEEEEFYLAKRKVFSDAVRKLWQKMRDLIDADPTLEYQDSSVHSEQSEFIHTSRTPELELALS